MKGTQALIAWSPTGDDSPSAGRVEVGRLVASDEPDWTAPYRYTGGAVYVRRRKFGPAESTAQVFIDFHTLVLRDGLLPAVVHEAFLAIDEYAEGISPDIRGARQPDP